MQNKITPMLWFDNQAEQAANYYVSIFKDGRIREISRYPEGAPAPAGEVMVVDFELFGQRYQALNAGPMFKFTEAISFVINCESQEEVDYYWDRLIADGGEPSMCGWLKDKFGLSWQVTPTRLTELFETGDAGQRERVMKAMMEMRKIDIPTLERAAAAQ